MQSFVIYLIPACHLLIHWSIRSEYLFSIPKVSGLGWHVLRAGEHTDWGILSVEVQLNLPTLDTPVREIGMLLHSLRYYSSIFLAFHEHIDR